MGKLAKMKQLLFCVAMTLACATVCSAQFKMKNSADNVTKSSIGYSVATPQGGTEDISVQLTLTKNSGAGSAYAILQKSNDGVGWENASTDTLKITGATTFPATKIWEIGAKRCYQYRTKLVTDTTTQSLKQVGTLHINSKNTSH